MLNAAIIGHFKEFLTNFLLFMMYGKKDMIENIYTLKTFLCFPACTEPKWIQHCILKYRSVKISQH